MKYRVGVNESLLISWILSWNYWRYDLDEDSEVTPHASRSLTPNHLATLILAVSVDQAE